MRNPYDASEGGAKALIITTVISRPKNGNPYEVSKPIIIKTVR